jgi:hypothetical protein
MVRNSKVWGLADSSELTGVEHTSEEREAPHFLKTLTHALAEADKKESSTDEPRR